MSSTRPKPVVLIILDGWGIAPPSKGNAISLADIPNIRSYQANYPVFCLQASGESVGLSWGEMGNSEVGHLNLGAGKIIYQSLPRINRAIADGSFFKNGAFTHACGYTKRRNSDLHIMGLFSTGGVHSYNEHAYALAELAKQRNVQNVYFHVFLDGRDAPYNSGKKFVDQLIKKAGQLGMGQIATLAGRYWAMDRDNRWDRIAKAYLAMTEGQSEKTYEDPLQAIEDSYNQGVYDEEFAPTVITKDGSPVAKIKDGDSLIFFNFRGDRARQITKAFVLPGFDKFSRPKYLLKLGFVAMTEYEKDLPMEIAFPPENVAMPLAKVITEAGLKQLHIAETEKYAHVTFFFNGGKEEKFEGEERIIVPSPQVAAYDQQPEMSAGQLTERLIKEMDADSYDFIVVNYANADMVAHTGDLAMTVRGIEFLDEQLGQLVSKILSKNGVALITADHGNAEEVYKLQTGEIDKEHSTNPVPFYVIGKEFKGKVAKSAAGKDLAQVTPAGVLADVAPTILKIMGLKRPEEMSGRPLI
ncbi:MAG TPA: 2,3-bisphosphoglycerate-independent phosphoglycerate mutase [Patescibacteria group bacterium]|nr:2,3-bisphosphoglycerate-independent phosphoglycerate mutase [Patescibacteria group bacterium]